MTGFTFAEPPRIARCPYCGTGRPQVAMRQDFGYLGGRLGHRRWAVFIITCCGGLLLAQGTEAHPDNAQAPIEALYPSARRAAAEIPETARRFLQEAMETLHAPNAAAVMAGGAVDAMLKHLGLTEGSVYSRINQAVSDHILTPAMGKWAHKVRLDANRPRHADTEDPFVSVPEAQQSVDFAEALGHYLFVLPSRIERGIEAATKEARASGGAA
jgi:hypothetical protein